MVLEPWWRSSDGRACATVSHGEGPGRRRWAPAGGGRGHHTMLLTRSLLSCCIYPVINNIGHVSFWVILAIGAVPSWCSTRTPLVTGGLSSSSSRWLPRTVPPPPLPSHSCISFRCAD